MNLECLLCLSSNQSLLFSFFLCYLSVCFVHWITQHFSLKSELRLTSPSSKPEQSRTTSTRCTTRHPFCPDRTSYFELRRVRITRLLEETSMRPDLSLTTQTERPTKTVEKCETGLDWDSFWMETFETASLSLWFNSFFLLDWQHFEHTIEWPREVSLTFLFHNSIIQ